MATYKVLQDIEAEDKLIGPLTLRQCIYAAIALAACWLSFIAITKHAGFLVVIFLPFIGFGVFFAFPWNKQQSTEVWALAKVRFALKPRKRIWDQSGVKELVTITAPKVLEDPRRIDNLSETEVRSRLKALADTIDSRGWAVKNAPIDLYGQPSNFEASDRLLDGSTLPMEVSALAGADTEDMFDLVNNPLARQVQEKIDALSAAKRQQMMDVAAHPELAADTTQSNQSGGSTQNYWYGTQTTGQQGAIPQGGTGTSAMPVAATPTAEEEAMMRDIAAQQGAPQPSYAHLRVIQPLSSVSAQASTPAAATAQSQPQAAQSQDSAQNASAAVTPPINPAILELANNNDLNVATIAREAHHLTSETNPDSSDEVVISLR